MGKNGRIPSPLSVLRVMNYEPQPPPPEKCISYEKSPLIAARSNLIAVLLLSVVRRPYLVSSVFQCARSVNVILFVCAVNIALDNACATVIFVFPVTCRRFWIFVI